MRLGAQCCFVSLTRHQSLVLSYRKHRSLANYTFCKDTGASPRLVSTAIRPPTHLPSHPSLIWPATQEPPIHLPAHVSTFHTPTVHSHPLTYQSVYPSIHSSIVHPSSTIHPSSIHPSVGGQVQRE